MTAPSEPSQKMYITATCPSPCPCVLLMSFPILSFIHQVNTALLWSLARLLEMNVFALRNIMMIFAFEPWLISLSRLRNKSRFFFLHVVGIGARPARASTCSKTLHHILYAARNQGRNSKNGTRARIRAPLALQHAPPTRYGRCKARAQRIAAWTTLKWFSLMPHVILTEKA